MKKDVRVKCDMDAAQEREDAKLGEEIDRFLMDGFTHLNPRVIVFNGTIWNVISRHECHEGQTLHLTMLVSTNNLLPNNPIIRWGVLELSKNYLAEGMKKAKLREMPHQEAAAAYAREILAKAKASDDHYMALFTGTVCEIAIGDPYTDFTGPVVGKA